jgi:hypothetical protein
MSGRRLLIAAVVAALSVTSGSFAIAAPRAGLAGHCPDANGVTVAVDYQELGAPTEVRCAVGPQATGVAALENAGFQVTGTARWGKAFVCRINGRPGTDTEACVNTPPASAYWSYWHATNGGQWQYSSQGASTYQPALGSYEGWSFSKNHGPTDNPPPRVTPTRPAAPPRQPAPLSRADSGVAGANWLAGELVDGALPGFAGPDWGLTADALFALSATGAETGAVADMLAAHVRSYNSYDDFGVPDVRIAGATAKLLVAALAADRDPTDFGGYDLRAETVALIDDAGRVADHGVADQSNTFGQALAVTGLSRTGVAPQPAVNFLLRQQCAAGGFRLSPDQFGTPAPTCDAATDPVLDPDSTAMAVQALLAADRSCAVNAKAAAEKGARWLLDTQRADGSFGGSGPTEASNTNSTGLAAQALAATGHQEAADRAATYVVAHQLTDAAERGAIAYNDESLADALANGLPEMRRDQWRRASAQAILGLAQVPLGDLGTVAPQPCPADYLVGQLVDGTHVEVTSGDLTFVDYGQTADVAFALLADGTNAPTLTAVLDYLGAHVAEYAHGAPFDKPDANYVGATAKLAFLYALAGRDPRAVGGVDLIAELAALQQPGGRFADDSDFGDFANVFGQSFAVLALTAADEPTDDAVAALAGAACADHSFPVSFGACATGTSDATGLAAQALNASADGPRTLPQAQHNALVGAVAALESTRDAESAWPGPGGQNVNSTGYAAMGLLAAGQDVDGTRTWLSGLIGADGGLPQNPGQPSNLFATAQALPAYAGRSFLTLAPVVGPSETIEGGTPPPPTTTPTTTPAGTTPPVTTSVDGGSPTAPQAAGLASTGVSVIGLLLAAAALLAGGVVARHAARRRTS